MRYSSSLLAAVIILSACAAAVAQGRTYQLGTTPSQEEIKTRDIAISPSEKNCRREVAPPKKAQRFLRRSAQRVMGQTATAAVWLAASYRSATRSL